MTRLLPSSPAYALYNALWDIYAVAVNPQCWCNIDRTADPLAWHVLLNNLISEMEELLDTPVEFTEWEMRE